jgi:NADPH:quinone reductase-like Zn-dependent oxidoreductase
VAPVFPQGHHHVRYEETSLSQLFSEYADGQEEDMDLQNTKRGLHRGLGGAIDGVATDYFVCDEEEAVAIPSNFSFEEGATLPVAFTTAWSSLYSHHPKLQAGNTVLCLGTGGVSLCAAQVSHFLSRSPTLRP